MARFRITTIDRDDPGRLLRFNGGDVQIGRGAQDAKVFIPLDVAYRFSTQARQLAPRSKQSHIFGNVTAAAVQRTGPWQVQIIRRCDQHRFVVLPKRWIVERTISWISHNRRLARDFERHVRCAAAFVRLAMIRIMMRRQARSSG